MRIQLLNGGLGNQVFQYIFARYVESVSNEPCYLDDSAFWLDYIEHNGFELKKVFPNAKLHLLSDEFTESSWAYLMDNRREGIEIGQQFKNNEMDLFLVAESNDFKFDGNVIFFTPGVYMPNIAYTQGNVYYHGYWVGRHWFDANADILREELSFPAFTEQANIDYLNKIHQTYSIAVHIRRGDFLKHGWNLPDSYYKTCLEKTFALHPDAVLFIFSDDMDYCQANEELLGFNLAKQAPIYIEGNVGGNNYRDMQLMAECKGMILSRSSFSYLAALLNKNIDQVLINPCADRAI